MNNLFSIKFKRIQIICDVFGGFLLSVNPHVVGDIAGILPGVFSMTPPLIFSLFMPLSCHREYLLKLITKAAGSGWYSVHTHTAAFFYQLAYALPYLSTGVDCDDMGSSFTFVYMVLYRATNAWNGCSSAPLNILVRTLTRVFARLSPGGFENLPLQHGAFSIFVFQSKEKSFLSPAACFPPYIKSVFICFHLSCLKSYSSTE